MTATAAKFPSALLALADLLGELPNFPALTLNGSINASVTSIVVNESIPATWPTLSWITVDSEIMRVTSYNAGTKTFTVAARDASAGNAQSTTAATHASGAYLFVALTAQQWNQVVADLIAVETQALVGPSTNQVLNSDFSRRTVFGLAMPEVFADTSGYNVLAGVPTVAANILTQNAANNEMSWPKAATFNFWRDARASATFKAVSTTGTYSLFLKRVDANNYVRVKFDGAGNFIIQKNIAGVATTVATVAQALTLNRWYWLELEAQGTTYIGKVYDTGGTVPGVTKASSTLLQTLTGTIADAAVVAGDIEISSDQATAQWGGIATGNGGVYVETWLPESWTPVTFGGTLGGQAIGYDESADSGPGTVAGAPYKQWAMRAYIPAASRTLFIQQNTADGSLAASTVYAGSTYMKVSGLGGSGTLVECLTQDLTSALGSAHTLADLVDAGVTAWTRKTATASTAATSRRATMYFSINPSSTATGTAYFMLPQLEQGSAVTAWRNAPADDAPIDAETTAPATAITTTSAAFVEIDPRNLAMNFFAPWDCLLEIEADVTTYNSGANENRFAIYVDASAGTTADAAYISGAANLANTTVVRRRVAVAAGKHRVTVEWLTVAGTATLYGGTIIPKLRITAYRGK